MHEMHDNTLEDPNKLYSDEKDEHVEDHDSDVQSKPELDAKILKER